MPRRAAARAVLAALCTALTLTGLAGAHAVGANPTGAQTGEVRAVTPAPGSAPPAPGGWEVGAQPLPRQPDGYGEVRPTPAALVDRRLPSADRLPPPPAGADYRATSVPVPAEVRNRSTWRPGCPVAVNQLRYLTLSFWGFDGRPHTGEMIVNARVADDVITVFGRLYRSRFPIEEMRVTARDELDAEPTGDGNNTTAFVCRPAVGLTRWSAHSYGLAVDLNPFHNPYRRGDLVLPELASAYLDRARVRPGMLAAGDPAVRAFTQIGWTWGGRWRDPVDTMHFSGTGG
ncbi:MAG: M15 family metallopeptidase [Pseudonocardia sp.]